MLCTSYSKNNKIPTCMRWRVASGSNRIREISVINWMNATHAAKLGWIVAGVAAALSKDWLLFKWIITGISERQGRFCYASGQTITIESTSRLFWRLIVRRSSLNHSYHYEITSCFLLLLLLTQSASINGKRELNK